MAQVPPVLYQFDVVFFPWEIEGGFMIGLYYCNDWNVWMN